MQRLLFFMFLTGSLFTFAAAGRAESAMPYGAFDSQTAPSDVWGLSGSPLDGTAFFLSNGLRQENRLLNSGFGTLPSGDFNPAEAEINHRFKVHRAVAISA